MLCNITILPPIYYDEPKTNTTDWCLHAEQRVATSAKWLNKVLLYMKAKRDDNHSLNGSLKGT